MKNKHLSLDERFEIEKGLNNNLSFKQIGNNIGKSCTTISREIRNHYITKNTGAVGRPFFDCINRNKCEFRVKGIKCDQKHCIHYQKENCQKLLKPPYVCNGCKNRNQCTLSKRLYDSIYSYKEYKDNLSESRSGVIIDQDEIDNLNSILVPLINEQNQSIYHAITNNKNKIMHSDKTIYKLIDLGILEVRNIDLQRKVKLKQRRKQTSIYKIDKKCTENRTYEDFLKYMKENPDTPIVEMDTVEGRKGGKVLLTIHFVNSSFMLAFIRDHNDAQSVINIFNKLQDILGLTKFKELFIIILTDNGSEFSNPSEIEYDPITEEKRTQIFYCHPSSPYEKGSCEVNHELLRRILPKGTSFDDLTQDDINIIMSHINSYKRKKLNDKSPYFMFSSIYGKDTIEKLNIKEINPNDVNLSTKLLKK